MPKRRSGTVEPEPAVVIEPAVVAVVVEPAVAEVTSRGRPRTPAGRAKLTVARLAVEYPGTAKQLCELDFSTPWQLLVATVLSAQTTDERVNAVTPALFERYPAPPDLAGADPADVEDIIRPTGFFRVKSRTVVALAGTLCERFACEVPTALEDLVTLPGVGRKTGNVVRSVAFGLPGFPVDTHVGRITRLLGLTKQKDPVKVEAEVTAMMPKREWGPLSLRMILHGRRICIARRPRCPECVLADFCPSAVLPLGWRGPIRATAVARTGPSNSGLSNTGPSKTGPSKTELPATGPAATGPAATGPTATGPAATGPAATGPAATGRARTRRREQAEPAGPGRR